MSHSATNPSGDAALWDEGWALLRAGHFREAHEPWEALWKVASGSSRALLQALIHLCASLYHAERGNRVGCRAQARRGLARLAGFQDVAPLEGVAEREAFPGQEGCTPALDEALAAKPCRVDIQLLVQLLEQLHDTSETSRIVQGACETLENLARTAQGRAGGDFPKGWRVGISPRAGGEFPRGRDPRGASGMLGLGGPGPC